MFCYKIFAANPALAFVKMADDICLICNNGLDGDVVTLKERGLLTVYQSSLKRDDGLANKLNLVSDLCVHSKCRKQYTNEAMIKAYNKRKFVNSVEEIVFADVFDYCSKCLFCNTDASEVFIKAQNKKKHHLRIKVHKIQMPRTKQTITDRALQRKDALSETILQRIQDVDLVAVEARYHVSCFVKFRLSNVPVGGKRKRGRPEADATSSAMGEIYAYVENHGDECQFSLNDLKSGISGSCPDDRTIMNKLKKKYGDDLVVSSCEGKTVICFRSTGSKILDKAWYSSRCKDNEEERLRIVRAAASIILEDIRSSVHDVSVYPPPDQFLDNAKDVIPRTLMTFTEQVILVNKKDTDIASRKCIAIAHAIMTAVRPHSFISSLLLGITTLIDQKYAAKSLINLLASLGFSLPYREASMLQISAISHPTPKKKPEFCQYVFDSADHNVNTIDGHHTFHSMGGVKCHTGVARKDDGILRRENIPPSLVVGDFGHVPLQTYKVPGKKGLRQVQIRNFAEDPDIRNITVSRSDILWLYSKKLGFDETIDWNGFMEKTNTNKQFKTSEIIPMPFVNNPPSDYETIYTTILQAVANSKSNGSKSTIITFDQPLYEKAKEITTSSEDPRLQSVIIRLGGFHLLMSYMGSIGYIMNGSGLKELWCVVYAPSSVEKLLSGHAYSRAVRANILTHHSLAKQVLDKVKSVDEDIAVIVDNIMNDTNEEGGELGTVITKFEEALEGIAANGPTAQLWILYFKMVTLLKQFIAAERSGDWNLHLSTVKKMLPFLHAAGYFSYSKSATLYLQDMENLQNILTPAEFLHFTEDGYFTIRRTQKFWSGVWSDMAIEQTLMRSMKSPGGLTHGRGMSDGVLSKWLLATPILSSISSSVEEFAGTSSSSTDQHIDNSRILRDAQDLQKFDKWFESHDPFPELDKIMSLSTGITGDSTINCHDAQRIGIDIMLKSEGMNFQDVKYSRNDRVLPIAAVKSSIRVNGVRVPVEPDILFQRIAFAIKSQDELKQCLKYELAPFPLPLFDINGMRKCKKSAFYDLFKPLDNEPPLENRAYVLDGEYLLHKVVWPEDVTFLTVLDHYVIYIFKHFGANCTVVFDEYPDKPDDKSMKTAQRQRRTKHPICPEVLFNENTTVTCAKEFFLSNEHNKKRFIEALINKLENNAIQTAQSVEVATTIIFKALENAENYETVVVVGENIDLLVILSGLPDTRKSKVFLLKPRRGKIERKYYSSTCFLEKALNENVMFIHAFSGCDSTSAIFRQGKKKLVDVLKKSKSLQKRCLVFKDANAKREAIEKAGEKIMAAIYATNSSKSLDDLRYELFSRSTTKSRFNLACLPPTSGATRQHSLRTYWQVQSWLGVHKEPENWGWTLLEGLTPIPTLDNPAPPEILAIISCKCKISCGNNCICRKAALNCSTICNNCNGKPCTGSIVLDEAEDPEEGEIGIEKTFTSCTDSGLPYDSDMDGSEVLVDIDDTDDEDKENEEQPSTSKKIKH